MSEHFQDRSWTFPAQEFSFASDAIGYSISFLAISSSIVFWKTIFFYVFEHCCFPVVCICVGVCTCEYMSMCIVYMYICMGAYVYMHVWKPEINTGCLPLLLSTSFFFFHFHMCVLYMCVYACLHICGCTWVYVCLCTHACGSPKLMSGIMSITSLLFTASILLMSHLPSHLFSFCWDTTLVHYIA